MLATVGEGARGGALVEREEGRMRKRKCAALPWTEENQSKIEERECACTLPGGSYHEIKISATELKEGIKIIKQPPESFHPASLFRLSGMTPPLIGVRYMPIVGGG